MVNELLEAVIKKHGEVEIFWNPVARGNFHLAVRDLPGELCFDLEVGLISLLSKDKLEDKK